VTIDGPLADLAMTLDGWGAAASRTTFTEPVTITNHGPAPAFGISTQLLVPSGLSPRSFPGATFADGVLHWLDPTLASGATIIDDVTFAVATNRVRRSIIGGVVMSSTAFDPDPSNNATTTMMTIGFVGTPPPGSQP
jgi:hypothetical protein